jgi:hypothetical protein
MLQDSLRPRLIAYTAMPARLREKEKLADIIFDDIVEKSSDIQGLIRSIDRLLRTSPNPVARRAAASVQSIVGTI